MSVLYHPRKANVVVDALCRTTMGSVSHIDKSKKDQVKDVHSFARLGVRVEDSSDGGFVVHNNSYSSLVVEMKSNQHIDKSMMELKELVLGKFYKAFS